MAAVFKIPYFALNPPLPIPTDAEIDAAPDLSLIYGGRRIVTVGDYFVVKFGEGVNLAEGENMIFIRERTKNYIVMERIAGQTLLSLWPQLQMSEKEAIVHILRSYSDELRTLPPPDYYGSLGRRSMLDGIFWTREPEPAINGPFASEEALVEAIALKYIYDRGPRYRADFYRQCLPRVLRNHRPTFTHGDYQRKNIMIQRLDGSPQSSNPPKWQIHIIDWEYAGWYPSFWEYALASFALQWDDDWCLWLQKALEPYIAEAGWMQTIRVELWS